jgi:hypothetical protein
LPVEILERLVSDLQAADIAPADAVSRLPGPIEGDERVKYLAPTDPAHLPVAYVANGDLDDALFNRIWRVGEPYVATNVKSEDGVWTPEYIIDRYGDKNIQVEVCRPSLFLAVLIGRRSAASIARCSTRTDRTVQAAPSLASTWVNLGSPRLRSTRTRAGSRCTVSLGSVVIL